MLVKLFVTVPCSAVLLLHMLPTTALALAAAQGELAADALHDLRVQLIADSAVPLAVLVLTVVLAVQKPRGLTKAGAVAAGKRASSDPAPYALPTWILWLCRFGIAVAVAFLAAHLAGKGIGGHGMG